MIQKIFQKWYSDKFSMNLRLEISRPYLNPEKNKSQVGYVKNRQIGFYYLHPTPLFNNPR